MGIVSCLGNRRGNVSCTESLYEGRSGISRDEEQVSKWACAPTSSGSPDD